MMDSFRSLGCNNGFATQKTPARNATTVSKSRSLLVGAIGVPQAATTVFTNNCHNSNNNITANNNTINGNNIIDNNNFAISQSPNTTNIILQQPTTLYNSNAPQQATFTLAGLNPFPTGQTTSPAYYTLAPGPSQSATTINSPIAHLSTNRNFNQPIIIGAPSSVFLPNIATNLARPQIINIAEQPNFIPRSALILNHEPVTPSTSHINRINVPNAFQNQNNLRPQLVWDFAPSSTTNQQQLKRPKQRKSLNSNQSNRPNKRQQLSMVSSEVGDNLADNALRIPQKNQSLTDNDLIKLMAVLNNPALTLTPVSASASLCPNGSMQEETNDLYEAEGQSLLKSDGGFRLQSKPVQSLLQAKSGETTNQPPKSVSNIIQSAQKMRPNMLNRPKITNQMGPTSNMFIPSLKRNQLVSNIDSFQSFNESSLMDNTKLVDKTEFRSPRLTDEAIAQSTFMSTSVKNLIMQQPALSSSLTSDRSISTHLLKHIANHNKEVAASQPPMYQNYCYQDYTNDVDRVEDNRSSLVSIQKSMVNCDDLSHISKVSEWMNQSSVENQKEIYLDNDRSYTKDGNLIDEWPFPSNHADFQRSHFENQHSFQNSLADPEDIFINRPKRIMSKIDTMVEKRRKRRFDKICQEPVTLSEKSDTKSKELLLDEFDEMDSENSLTQDGMPEDYEYSTVISNQLPLENDLSEEKSEYLANVGLLSIRAKNNLQADLCVRRQKELRCPVEEICFDDLPERTKRIFNAMATTRGYDLQLKIGTSLRRNDLSEIEGLDRTSSRTKLTYMNTLGMAKKNRRTALYRVKSVSDDMNRLQDLNNRYQDTSFVCQQESTLVEKFRQSFRQQLMHDTDTVDSMVMSSLKPYRISKGQFMSSLGLSKVQQVSDSVSVIVVN